MRVLNDVGLKWRTVSSHPVCSSLSRVNVFRLFTNLFRSPTPPEPFIDSVLGDFEFETGLGWKRVVQVENSDVELVLGSDGECPNELMLNCARSWLDDWQSEKTDLLNYIRREIDSWTVEPDPPSAEKLRIRSINILWPEQPQTCIIYFQNPGDEIRLFHLTLNGHEPLGFAYDD